MVTVVSILTNYLLEKGTTMIQGFETQTAQLTDYESSVLLPVFVKCLNRHVGKGAAITNKKMREGLEAQGYDVGDDARVRKIINHIRNNVLVECLIASSKGYYVTTNKREMREYIDGLKKRSDAILAIAEALTDQMERMQDGPKTCS